MFSEMGHSFLWGKQSLKRDFMESHPVSYLLYPGGSLTVACFYPTQLGTGSVQKDSGCQRRPDTRTHRAVMRTRDGVTSRAHSGFWNSASTFQRAVSPALCLPSLSLSLMPSNSPVFPGTVIMLSIQRTTTSEERDREPTPLPGPRWLSAEILHKPRKVVRVRGPLHHSGLIKPLCAASATICSHCLLSATWQGNARWFSS